MQNRKNCQLQEKNVEICMRGRKRKPYAKLVRLKDFKSSITLHLRGLATDRLRSAVEHTIRCLEILQVNEGGHLERPT
ncbi:hypothetical protein TNCV_4022681 [Trichonephila clavipes]|nr:hypothetical protein TNCV_4022681 [Trichonephila clavipes]